MNTRKLAVGSAIFLLVAVLTGAAMTGVFTQDKTTDGPTVSTTVIETAEGGAGSANEFGLLPAWQAAYNGTSGTHSYDFNGSATNVVEECGNCHMHAVGSGGIAKHEPPLHPIGVGANDTGAWFFDDQQHRGPNTRLATQFSGIQPNVQCGDCHTPTNQANFGTPNSGATNDPHSVHRDVMTREGCIRCHNYDSVTFSGAITFTQDNATRATFGIANPINMSRVWDGKFLSTSEEAAYGSNLQLAGQGWNRYGTADTQGTTPVVNQFGCADCHGLYHEQGGLGFTFNDTAGSRKGPLAPVKDTNSIGVTSGAANFTCGNCHATDAHAVHTNGGIVTATSFQYAQGTTTDPAIHNASARGAEYCDECHSQNVGAHFGAPQALGLDGAKDNLPDAASQTVLNPDADCGFCHP